MEKQIRFTKENLIKDIAKQTNNNITNVAIIATKYNNSICKSILIT